MADRYLYAPSLGFCWLVAATIVGLGGRIAQPRARTAALVGLSLVPLVVFLARTRENLPVWRDSESLWTYAVTRCQDFRAYTNLAEVRLGQKRWDEAEQLLRLSARVDNATTYQNFAVLYYELGRYPEAVNAINRALAILRKQGWDPGHASVLYYNLGAIYWKLGQKDKTIQVLEAAIRENPLNDQAREQLRLARENQGAPLRK
jgi:tetratricopeptide (TPR) repeat protein